MSCMVTCMRAPWLSEGLARGGTQGSVLTNISPYDYYSLAGNNNSWI